jgi:diadenosine tetraphosphatase ApaH/serine/threonine PP2A family protein phosphatase
MRVLVMSDIHANLPALQSVLDNAGDVDTVWCLGDVIGYGPNPNECIELLRGLPNLVCLLGNHDAAALGRIPSESFNDEARQSIHWTRAILKPANRSWLEERPEMAELDGITLAHGSPRNPVWEYILDQYTARLNFKAFKTAYCLVGHTHIPIAFHMAPRARTLHFSFPPVGESFTPMARAILNPGSVGQPRDHDPRAAYAIFDTSSSIWMPMRSSYDIRAVQAHIRDAELPERHALRLAEGW